MLARRHNMLSLCFKYVVMVCGVIMFGTRATNTTHYVIPFITDFSQFHTFCFVASALIGL